MPTPAAKVACTLFVPRLPGVSRTTCLAAKLEESGAFSRNGVPLYWRDVVSQAPGASTARAPLRVLVLGAIHGDELTAGALALRWIELADKTPRSVHWRFVPVANPDGLLAKKPQRTNAKGVDLNRNFRTPGWDHDAPTHWKTRARKDPRRWPGTEALSEPETRFVNDQIARFKPDLVVSIHAPYGVLDFDGPVTPPRQLGALRLEQVGVFPGSLGHFGGLQMGLPVVTIELPNALRMPKEAEQLAMWADLLRWMDARLPSDVRQAKGAPAAGKLSIP
ncbi:MAG: M14 family zinc carboxypeptidase [Giesbergeria sp.]